MMSRARRFSQSVSLSVSHTVERSKEGGKGVGDLIWNLTCRDRMGYLSELPIKTGVRCTPTLLSNSHLTANASLMIQ